MIIAAIVAFLIGGFTGYNFSCDIDNQLHQDNVCYKQEELAKYKDK